MGDSEAGGCKLSDDEHDWGIVSAADADGLFAVVVAERSRCVYAAFDRGHKFEWFRLIDLTYVSVPTGEIILAKIFKLTPVGIARRDELKFRFTEAANKTPA